VGSPAGTTRPPVSGRSVAYADNGRTIRIARGTALDVVLDSTYWTMKGSSDAAVLAPITAVRHSGQPPGSSCVPGAGCGTVSQSYVARRTGPARVSAERTVCGEAMACTPSQRVFVVSVIVV
jgi:hypothetical protein